MPHARKLIDDASSDLDSVKLISDAFEAAWNAVHPAFQIETPPVINDARAILAQTIIRRVKAGLIQPELLQEQGKQALRRIYPWLPV